MTFDPEQLPAIIGGRVRERRRALGLTLDELAARSEVSRRMLVNVEQGATNPSIATLLRLSAPLGLSLPELVALPESASPTVTRAGEGRVLWQGERGGRGTLVASTPGPDVVELWDWTLEPGERHESEAHSAGTRELLQVLEGAVAVEAGGAREELAAGDAIAFAGDVDHAYEHAGTGPARFSLTVVEPGAAVGRTARGSGR